MQKSRSKSFWYLPVSGVADAGQYYYDDDSHRYIAVCGDVRIQAQ